MSAARAVLLESFREKAWGSSHGFCRVELAFYTRDNEQWDSTGSSLFLLPQVKEYSVKDKAGLLGMYL